ncbi:GrdX family protein [Fusibacter sp. JL298sf-3]
MFIVTNNPKVKDYYEAENIQFVEGSYYDVLVAIRDLIHVNHKLLTHPLSGSIKPNETPYKSVAVEPSNVFDMEGLHLIEKAIETYRKLQKDSATPNWTPRIKEDFMVIDYDLIKNAIRK